MKRKANSPYLLVFITLFGLMSIPKEVTEKLQGTAIAFFAPAFERVSDLRHRGSPKENISHEASEEYLKLQLENQLLKNEVHTLKDALQQKLQTLALEFDAIPAKVIYRSPASWNSSLWINVGLVQNEEAKKTVIAKNSPVVVGTCVVGVVDYVGKRQSRVRLITDSGLTPSVRALRGNIHQASVIDTISKLIQMVDAHEEIFSELSDKKELLQVLDKVKKEINQDSQLWHLAKGELHGSSQPLWRSSGQLLKGIGFNYDYADTEGPARDLRSGKPMDTELEIPTMPIIQVNDLLVTTGMDGVFPPNLSIAEVTSINLLKEGDYYYELEAKPTAGNLDELSIVFVIPPSEHDEREQPPHVGW